MPSTIAGIVAAGQRDLRRREGLVTRMLVDRYALLWNIIAGEIATIDRQITEALQAGEIEDAERWAHRQRWFGQLQDSIGTELERFTADGLHLIAGAQQDAVSVALNGARRISTLAQISTPFAGRVNAAAMDRYVSALQPGSPLRGVFARYSEQTQTAIMDGIFEGMGRREGTGSIVRAVREKAGPDVSTGKLATITRTETMRAYRGSARDSYEALGPEIISQWEWRAAKSARTCAACLAYDGRRFPYKQYPDRFHVNCRCVVVPVPHKDLIGEGPERETGAAWLARQDEATQRKVLGTRDRFEAYQDGVPLRDFIGVKRNRTWGPSLYVKPAGRVRVPEQMSGMNPITPAFRDRYDAAKAKAQGRSIALDDLGFPPRTYLETEVGGDLASWLRDREYPPEIIDRYTKALRADSGNVRGIPLSDMDLTELSRIRPMQKNVVWSDVDAMVSNWDSVKDNFDDSHLVFKLNGEYLLRDGHHRTVAAILSGETSLPVNLIDLDTPSGRRP